jgi:hypothetical protein
VEHHINGGERSVQEQRGGYLVLVQDTGQLQVAGVFAERDEAEEAARAHTEQTQRKAWVIASVVAFDQGE